MSDLYHGPYPVDMTVGEAREEVLRIMQTSKPYTPSVEREWTPPRIQANVDGPLLVFSNGELHWLTMRERIGLFFGRVDAERLQRKYRPDISPDTIAKDVT